MTAIERSKGWWIARCLVIAAILCAGTDVRGDDIWWDQAWPYRAVIESKPGRGDVASVEVILAGRSTDDGRDLRLVDAEGELVPFDLLHHDGKLRTKLAIRTADGKAARYLLYYGNAKAERINPRLPDLARQRQRHDAWQHRKQQRDAAVARKQALEAKLQRARNGAKQLSEEIDALPAEGEAADRVRQQKQTQREKLTSLIAEAEAQLKEAAIPEVGEEPAIAAEWEPSRGLTLRIYRKYKPTHPNKLPELHKAIGQAQLEGADYRDSIADGYNPFGTSEEYISVYEGWLRIDREGEYGFCTASDDGSWIVVNGRLIHAWPGGHGYGDGARGERNGTIKLEKGVAHVQYYHEEGGGGQLAFMGWRRPGDKHFGGIPKNQWLPVREARVTRYEAKDNLLMAMPDVQVEHTYWIKDSDDWQATMVRCRDASQSADGKIKSVKWTFGDGLAAPEADVRHAYFRNGRPTITLTVTDSRGRTDQITCQPNIFQVDVVAKHFTYGKAADYASVAGQYDLSKLDRHDLLLLTTFWRQLEDWPRHLAAAESFLKRFPKDEQVRSLAAQAAAAALKPGAYDPKRAVELYGMARSSLDRREALDLVLDEAAVLSWHLDKPDETLKLLEPYRRHIERETDQPRQRLRPLAIAFGDCALLRRKYEEAEALYRRVEAEFTKREMKQPEKLAKIGSYPYAVEDLLGRDEFERAIELINEWESDLPTQKLEGYTFFLRGKVLYVEKPGELALRYLDLAERVAPTAVHVPETVWIRANCLMKLGKHEEALAEFERIRHDFTYSEFFGRAAERIEQCREKMGEKQ